MNRDRLHVIFGVPFDGLTMPEALAAIDDAIRRRERLFVSTPNLSFFTQSARDAAFRDSLFESDLSLADGAPVLWLARLLRTPIPCRVPGSDLYDAMRARQPKEGQRPLRVYFFGGPEGAAEQAFDRVNRSAAGIRAVGWSYPGFRSAAEMSDPQTIEAINNSEADLLVVALGARKGQEWLMLNRDRIRVPVRVHLGAVINFEAGRIQRAPALFRRFALEWLWRIKEEPELFKRYAADFMTLVRLLITGVIPDVWWRFRTSSDAALLVERHEHGNKVTVTLSGHAGNDQIDGLVTAFDTALAAGKDVVLEVRGLQFVGTAALGQFASLKRALDRTSCRLSFEGLTGQPHTACHAFGMDAVLGLSSGTAMSTPPQ